MNKYVYELVPYEGKPIADVIEADDLMQAFNIIDGEFGLSSGLFRDVSIKLLKKGI